MHDLGGLVVSYHYDTPFELLDNGFTTECRLGMIFLLGALLTYIVMLRYASIVIYSFYLIMPAIWVSKLSPEDG